MTDTEKAALERRIDELCAEVERLKEREQNLVTLLRNDCDIEASWDGLRKFWYIGLTESGCLMRDRACKAETENAKLRQQLADVIESVGRMEERCAKLRDLVRDIYIDMWNCGEWLEPYEQRMHELEIWESRCHHEQHD